MCGCEHLNINTLGVVSANCVQNKRNSVFGMQNFLSENDCEAANLSPFVQSMGYTNLHVICEFWKIFKEFLQ